MSATMQWYYAKGGAQSGPIGDDELKAKIAAGEVGPTDLVWREGMGDWTPAGQVAELRAAPAPAAYAPPPVMQGAQAGVEPTPYQPPMSAGYGGSMMPAGGRIPNYLWQAIVVTVLCCVPFGIPAIVFAAKVDGLVARGDIAGAQEASRKAKMWCWWAFGLGLAGVLIYVALVAVAGVTGNLQ